MAHSTNELSVIVQDVGSSQNKEIDIDAYPDVCPFCDEGGHPSYKYGKVQPASDDPFIDAFGAQLVFLCPRQKCKRLYFGFYKTYGGYQSDGTFHLNATARTSFLKLDNFPSTVTNISKKFQTIYNQAKIAEGNNLNEICGPGYRKSLEFLVKDYLISKYPDQAEQIKSSFLWPLIKTKIPDDRIKKCAKNAAYLGNDETHYKRKFEDKDLNDLKTLIRLTVYWIDAEISTEDIDIDMSKTSR